VRNGPVIEPSDSTSQHTRCTEIMNFHPSIHPSVYSIFHSKMYVHFVTRCTQMPWKQYARKPHSSCLTCRASWVRCAFWQNCRNPCGAECVRALSTPHISCTTQNWQFLLCAASVWDLERPSVVACAWYAFGFASRDLSAAPSLLTAQELRGDGDEGFSIFIFYIS